MGWRQTTLFQWLTQLRGALVIGTSIGNPIEILDDSDDAGPVPHESFATATNSPIAISDSDEEPTPPLGNKGAHHSLPDAPAGWPSRVPHWSCNRGRRNVKFMDVDLGTCVCTRKCLVGECAKAKSATFCDDSNCTAGELCGNRLLDHESLRLTRCIKGLGVFTAHKIPALTIVGEYCGYILLKSKLTVEQRNRGFVLKFHSRDTNGARVALDAAPGGSLCRFVNHSCSPNSRFEERQHRRVRRMVVVTQREILPGEEITVLYNKKVSFACLCGEANCQSKKTDQQEVVNYIS